VAADRDPRPDSHVPGVDAAGLRRRDRLRFLAVALGALGLCALYAWRGYFSSDFWEHAAVVRELSVRTLAPRHPLLAVDAPHAYASPYLLVVGLAGRVTGAAPTTALAIAGLVNMVLLVLALRRFLARLPHGDAAAPYALLFIIFLWGKDVWMWSGFLHIGMLGYNAPYPSTFAAAAMFLCLSILMDALESGRTGLFAAISLLVAVCMLTHPPTALVLFAGLAALFFARVARRFWITAGLLFGAVFAGVALALTWPYFPVLKLFADQPPEFHSWSAVFYHGVVGQIWPAILALPALLWRLRGDRRDPLVLLVALLTVIYAIGGITGRYGLGRTIAYIVVFIQIALAIAAVVWESRLPKGRSWQVPAGSVVAALALFAHNKPPLPRIIRVDRQVWPEAKAILAPVRPGDVVLADSRTSYLVPALSGGRVVAWRHPVYWIPDHAERRKVQDQFFGNATDQERHAVIARYHVQWILLDRREVPLGPEEERRLLGLGCVVADRGALVLIEVADRCAAPASASAL
jgi:hypothetical protein